MNETEASTLGDGDDSEGGKMLWCVMLAGFAGLVYTGGVAATALPTFLASKNKRTISKTCTTLMTTSYIALMALANGPLIYACNFGPVAVVVPVAIGTYMLTNMLLQAASGMTYYDKNMRIGTIVLALAAMMLMDVGPKEAHGDIDVLALLSTKTAIIWMAIVGAFILLGLVVIASTRDQGRDSFTKIIGYTLVVGFAAAMNNTTAKVLTVMTGSMWYAVLGVFILGSIISGATSAISCTVLNCSISVPLMSCVQVFVNGLSGIFIWGDAERINTWESYISVYIFFFIGIYLCSHADEVQYYMRYKYLGKDTDFLHHRCQSKYGETMYNLFTAICDAHNGTSQPGEINKCFKEYLSKADTAHIGTQDFESLAKDIVALASNLGGDQQLAKFLSRWLAKHNEDYEFVMQQDKEFAREVHEIEGLGSGTESEESDPSRAS